MYHLPPPRKKMVMDFNFGKWMSVEYICLGAHCTLTVNQTWQCFVWKKIISQPWGSKSPIFGRDDLDPLYFYVSNFPVPPDPPICLKCPNVRDIFSTFRSPLAHWKCCLSFLSPSIYVGTLSFHFWNIFQWKKFHRHHQRHRHQSPMDFLKIG